MFVMELEGLSAKLKSEIELEETRVESIERLIAKFADALETKRESVARDAELLEQMQNTQGLGE